MAAAATRAFALRAGRKALQTLRANVLPIVHPLETNLADGGVSALDSCPQVLSDGGDSQNPASAGQQLVILHPRGGVKHFDAADRFGSLAARDDLSGFGLAGIALGGENNTEGRVRAPMSVYCSQLVAAQSQKQLYQIRSQAHHDGLRFGISEADVVFQDLGPRVGQHQATVKDTSIT